MSNEELIAMIEREEAYFGNTWWVTVSGGEPLLQAKNLLSFFTQLKKLWVHTALDTNASLLNDDVKKLLEVTDLVIPDIKHMNNARHEKITWNSNEKIFEFINYLEKIWKNFWVRYVLVPGYTDQVQYIQDLGGYLKQFTYLQRVEILPYHTLGKYKWDELGWDYELSDVKLPKKEELMKVKEILDKYVKNVYVRN
jgi:pyruvate formate lyase activating enzyme